MIIFAHKKHITAESFSLTLCSLTCASDPNSFVINLSKIQLPECKSKTRLRKRRKSSINGWKASIVKCLMLSI